LKLPLPRLEFGNFLLPLFHLFIQNGNLGFKALPS
jgi:hypothetical protein